MGKPPARQTARDGNAWDARQIRREGVDVVQIHGERVVRLFTEQERRCRRRRRQDGIALSEGALEVAA